jgi:hypothetical protein
MKSRSILPLLLFLLFNGPVRAIEQDSSIFPQLSPYGSVSQTIGTTTVTVDFHRPAVRGRKIWGDLVPYGQVWRTGANQATTIRFTDAVKINGSTVPAGTYALFTIPGPDQWVVILNKRWHQLGAYEYQAKDDVVRFQAKPKIVSTHTEWLSYGIEPASRSSAYVDLRWERLRVSFLVEVDVDALVAAHMKRAIARAKRGDWKLYADAALYYLEQNAQLDQALVWAEKSIRIQENPTNLFVKGRLLRELGQLGAAMATLEKALKLALAQRAPGSVTGPIQQTLEHWKRVQGMNGRGN